MTDIVGAAECALRFALINEAFMNNSRIPLLVHQTSRSANPKTWSSVIRNCVERWVSAATASNDPPAAEMAWFMWDDDGVDALVEKYENDMYPKFATLPYPVEKADVFRVLVLKWFGGVVSIRVLMFQRHVQMAYTWQYADIDAQPLAHPYGWIHPSDLEDWSDQDGNKHEQYRPSQPAYVIPNGAPSIYTSRTGVLMAEKGASDKTVSAVFGLEADNPPEPDDTYWRMGYTFPVQITNWAMAMSPHHPVADLFLSDVSARILANVHHLRAIDPLNITGPPALTHIVKDHSERTEPGFAWQSISNRGRSAASGRAKIVAGDTLVLPITGFSPGRGWFHNMGSQPKDHPSARLEHLAAGSWRRPDLKVTYGKLCRTVFGLCREWSKIPDP
jgi:mannosyltransferase OCH1-like enzyme